MPRFVSRAATALMIHVCEVRPRKDHRGVDLISDVLPIDLSFEIN
jgi:hypothetical protein